jgi:hypothetical protein
MLCRACEVNRNHKKFILTLHLQRKLIEKS